MKKIALVTGGSRGLGKDMALALAGRGIDVVLTYNSQQKEAENVAQEIGKIGAKAAVMQLQVGDIKSLARFTDDLRDLLRKSWNTERFDFLINNAGIGATIPMASVTEEMFDEFMNIHYKGVYFLTQQSLPMMNDGGGVVFISSGTTRFANPGYSVYASLKGAV